MLKKHLVTILLLSVAIQAQSLKVASATAPSLPNAPQPNTAEPDNTFSSGLGFDNQLYVLQGLGVATMVGQFTNRPWLGATAGVGSCMLWRVVHDQGYTNDRMFGSNRVAFCALGSAVGYATDKWLFGIHRGKDHRTRKAVPLE
jgi:hypothetical protein